MIGLSSRHKVHIPIKEVAGSKSGLNNLLQRGLLGLFVPSDDGLGCMIYRPVKNCGRCPGLVVAKMASTLLVLKCVITL